MAAEGAPEGAAPLPAQPAGGAPAPLALLSRNEVVRRLLKTETLAQRLLEGAPGGEMLMSQLGAKLIMVGVNSTAALRQRLCAVPGVAIYASGPGADMARLLAATAPRARVDSSAAAAKEVDPARKERRESWRASRSGKSGGDIEVDLARRGAGRAVTPKVSS